MRPRQMWTDYRDDCHLLDTITPPSPTAHTVHQPERQAGPIAVIHLPKDKQHLVYPPRERLGFRR